MELVTEVGTDDAVTAVVLLVGGNPLPNYLAAATLRPEAAVLLYTPETARTKERLRAALSRLGIEVDEEETSPYAAEAVQNSAQRVWARHRGAHLVYAGGTKVMAAHARLVFEREVGRGAGAYYVDEGNACLRRDDGDKRPLTPVDIDLFQWIELHGIGIKHDTGAKLEPPTTAPSREHIERIASKLLAEPQQAKTLYDLVPKDGDWLSAAKQILGWRPPVPDTAQEIRKRWAKDLRGDWLEPWVQQHVRDAAPGLRVWYDVNGHLYETKREFQVDVVGLDGLRSYVLSCTTDTTPGQCKSKAFEAAARARQLGGDLARWALVCFATAQTVGRIKEDVASSWSSPATPAVFGLDSLRAWRDGDRSSLTAWLEGRA